ncbi:MAG: hypothetical protein K0Q53_66 [Massilibacillus sp.]|jgi:cell wall-associated NlpC family hydrolase|nr:hypothetical protein [Massilibacillus sp.]
MTGQEKLERENLIKELLTWENTQYHPEARVKQGGCDCGTLILQSFENVGLIEHIDLPHYAQDVACHCAVPTYLMKIKEYCREVESEPIKGDIIVYHFKGAKVPHHAAVCIDNEFIIHSYTRQGVIRSNRRGYKQYEVGIYRFNKWAGE